MLPSRPVRQEVLNNAQWFLVAGFECADLSTAGSGKGLEGAKSAPTYHAMLQTLGWSQKEQCCATPPLYFIENTVHHTATPDTIVQTSEILRGSLGKEVIQDAELCS